ncbi:MAG TPA: cyclic nucleotide-binding domain-containing protein [bacterium]|nr:cyclic nucleotide-binding domain-containing protein [bacterium]
MREIDDLLADHPFFRGLPPDDLALIAGCASNVRFDGGSYLFHEGDPSDRFYLIRHGRVAIEISSPGRGRMTISTLGPGEMLGWSWLVPPYRKQSDSRALELVRATAFDGACIRKKCEEDPRLGYELLKRFAQIIGQRLRATRMQLLDVYGTWG